jgi:outer membrane protein assembly factor BamB/subtilisin family serine protease
MSKAFIVSVMHRMMPVALAIVFACAAAASPFSSGGFLSTREQSQSYREGIVLAKPKLLALPTVDRAERDEGLSLRAQFQRLGNVRVIKLQPGDTVEAAVTRLMATGRYEYVEPDYVRRTMATVPSDPYFSSQWGLSNTGANGGLAGADINAEAGWAIETSAKGVVVGMLDSGALTTHQDLAGNLWVNPSPGTTTSYASVSDTTGRAETVSETDSLNGLNGVAKTGLPTDDEGHGTLTSGVVGAVGNNGLGVSGVAWQVQLMELKFLDSTGSGTISDELPCIDYAIAHGVQVINASFGSSSGSQAEMDAIQQAGKAGIVFVCASGNSGENIDISPAFPADYPLDNIICVGATDNRDLPVYFSNYGSGSVEIFAPGDSIISTAFLNTSSYAYASGTSLATPFVTGAVALLKQLHPSDTYRQTINRVLNGVDTNPALSGKAQTNGRLDLAKVLGAASTTPNATFAGRIVLVGLDPYTRSNNADTPQAPEGGTPTVAGTAGVHSQWWQWTAPQDATVEIDTSGTGGGSYITGGSTYPTLLGVYTGSSLGSLVLVKDNATYATEPLEGNTGTKVGYSEVTFHASAGTTYQILVQGQSAQTTQTGQTVLAINTDPDNDALASARVLSGPSVSLQDANVNATTASGEPAIMGNAGGHSLWYSWTAPSTGQAQVSGYSLDFDPEVAVYTGSSISTLSLVSSAASTGSTGTTTAVSQCLSSFAATAGTTYLICVDGKTANDIGEFTLSIADSRWQGQTGDAITCSPSVGPNGMVYVGSNDNSFYAFNQNGTVAWSYAGASVFDTSSAAIGTDGTVYAGCTDGNLYAFTASGGLKWKYTAPTPASSTGLDNGISSSPALGSDGTIYFHDDNGNLYAISSAGALVWTVAVPGLSYAAPTIAPDGTIYIGTDSGSLYAFTSTGTRKWVYTAPVSGESIYTAAAIDASGNLYFGTLSGNFYSVTPAGTLRWTYLVGNGVTSAPALANGAVYFGGYDGYLYSLNTASGALNWKYSLGTQVRASAPAVDASGTIYIGSYDHNVYAVSSSGTLVRTYASDDWIRSSPLIAGTTLYFGSNDHKLYAFDLGVGSASADWPMYQYGSRRTGRAQVDTLAITSQPVTQTVSPGAAVVLSVSATGPSPLSYQWSLNGTSIAGAVNSDYTLASASAANAGTYTVTVTGGSSSVTSSAATLTVQSGTPPTITTQPASQTVSPGASVTFSVVATGSSPLSYQWSLNGTAIAGAVSSSYTIAPASAANNGSYTVTVTSGALSVTSAAATLTVGASTPPAAGRIVNLSARANVGAGGNILIAGFVIQGTGGKNVLLRGIGPTLWTGFNVPGELAQPLLTLISQGSGATLATNDAWGGGVTLANLFTQVGAFSLPANSADAAILETGIQAGQYSSQLSGLGSTTGVALAEIYDADSGTPSAYLGNISARANVGSGANLLIAGFVIEGSQPVKLLLRGAGPSLSQFGVAGSIAQPTIGLYDQTSVLIASNTGWGISLGAGTSSVAATVRLATSADMTAVGAFGFNTGSADSAMVATLPAGSYTLQLGGVNGTSGVGLVEVYLMP